MLSYCGELVKKQEPDLFLLSLFAKANVREYLWALFAFYHEISKTRYVVSESTLGLIRLQWWRDCIGEIYDNGYVQAHEVLKPLAEAIDMYNLPRESFDNLIYAREFDLENVSPGNIEGLLNYCDFTTTPMFELALRIMGDNPQEHLVQPIAMNYSLIRVLIASRAHAKDGWLMLPEDLCLSADLTLDNFFENDIARNQVIRDVVAARLAHVPTKQDFLKGAQALSDIYFKNLKSHNYNVLSQKLKVDPPFKVLRLFCKTKLL